MRLNPSLKWDMHIQGGSQICDPYSFNLYAKHYANHSNTNLMMLAKDARRPNQYWWDLVGLYEGYAVKEVNDKQTYYVKNGECMSV